MWDEMKKPTQAISLRFVRLCSILQQKWHSLRHTVYLSRVSMLLKWAVFMLRNMIINSKLCCDNRMYDANIWHQQIKFWICTVRMSVVSSLCMCVCCLMVFNTAAWNKLEIIKIGMRQQRRNNKKIVVEVVRIFDFCHAQKNDSEKG